MSQNDVPDFQEKRRFPRITIEKELTFTINDCDDVLYVGTTQNLCTCGVYLTTDCSQKLGTKIKIMLNAHEHPLIAEGNVVRCKFDKKDTELFHVSIELPHPSKHWQQFISNHMPAAANESI